MCSREEYWVNARNFSGGRPSASPTHNIPRPPTRYGAPQLIEGNEIISVDLTNMLTGLLDGRKYLEDNNIALTGVQLSAHIWAQVSTYLW